jgi:hypothetical protein
LLLGDADRERLFDQLSRHAAAGRIGIEELERRVAALTEAMTQEDAAAVMADLPALGGEPAGGRPADRGPAQRWWSRGHGHGASDRPMPEWRPTSERFRDPGTKAIMRVWVDGDGGRHYVVDDGP